MTRAFLSAYWLAKDLDRAIKLNQAVYKKWKSDSHLWRYSHTQAKVASIGEFIKAFRGRLNKIPRDERDDSIPCWDHRTGGNPLITELMDMIQAKLHHSPAALSYSPSCASKISCRLFSSHLELSREHNLTKWRIEDTLQPLPNHLGAQHISTTLLCGLLPINHIDRLVSTNLTILHIRPHPRYERHGLLVAPTQTTRKQRQAHRLHVNDEVLLRPHS